MQPSGRREPVYNLTVAGDHEYFANGVLVSNCDALRYACLAIDRWFDGEAEKDKPAYEEGTIGEALGLNDEEDDA